MHRLFVLFLFLFTLLAGQTLEAQSDEEVKKHTVFFIGNTSFHRENLQHLQQLKIFFDNYPEEFSVLHLGDLIDHEANLEQSNSPELKKLDLLLSFADNPKGKLYVIPGDIDWANSGESGNKRVKALHDYIAAKASKDIMLISNGNCPGPTILDIATHVRVVAFNSQWWIHPFDKPIDTDTDCKVLVKDELLEEITDAIEDAGNRNVLVASHHPVFSGGIYGGYSTPKMHLFPNESKVPLPLFGSVYTAYLQNVGTPKYMSFPAYDQLSTQLQRHFIFRRGLIFAAAHDFNLQLIRHNNNYQLVSGSIVHKEPMRRTSGTIYRKNAYGFMSLEYFPDGQVQKATYLFENGSLNRTDELVLFDSPCNESGSSIIPENFHYIPCRTETPTEETDNLTTATSQKISAGNAYEAGFSKKLLLGKLYRESWTATVDIPYLDLEKEKGGLTPYSVGGGRQTTSLKFRATDGKEYTFRSVNKDPIKALPPQLRETILVSLIREMTATQQPYGALPVAKMLDATDILHARPKLYVLPDHPALGPYRNSYKGLFGMLEDDPSKPKNGLPGFNNADDVDRSFTMFRKIYDDNDVYVDAPTFAKARAFDMLIGDWGRHPDNWKWALYKDKKKEVFYPIPRDRDHSFSRWDGLIPFLADREWARPNVQNFTYKIKGIRSLNWPARHLDRLLLTSLNKKDWLQITEELQSEITDNVIDSAIQAFPKEIISLQGAEIGEKLKARRVELPQAVEKHYDMLAKLVDVVGSNKHEYFFVERLEDGKVHVQEYKKKKEDLTLQPNHELIYERTFLPTETKEIRLYGLGGNDVFHLKGTVERSIKVRIIGGNDADFVKDESAVANDNKATLVYDNTNTKVETGKSTMLKLANTPDINRYDRQGFKYNTYFPTPLLAFNADDGVAFKFGIDFTRHAFRQSPYKQRYGFDAKIGTEGTRSIAAYSEWANVVGKWFMGVDGIYADIFPFYNYFDLGNETDKNDQPREFFRTNYKGADVQLYVRNEFWNKSYFKGGLRVEDYQSVIRENTILAGDDITGTNPITIAGFTGELDVDFRNGDVYATKGLRFYMKHQSGWLLNEENKYFSLSEAFGEFYSTYRIITLALKFGGARNSGNNVPYFKYANLGQSTNLRGFLRNRFAGNSSMYFNSELRLPLGSIKNPVFPFVIGVSGFFDVGRVWYEDPVTGRDPSVLGKGNTWHEGYGGGIYLVPILKKYTFSVSAATSKEESILLIFGLGFGIGR